MAGSTAFDRAAAYYDATRGRSPEGVALETRTLAAELGGRGRVLEVGVGTGQVALPLHRAGVAVTGIDLAEPMLHVLRSKAGGTPPFPIVLADATRMPFADDGFGGAYLRWVLHLIPAWERAVAEVARIVRPRGVFLVNLGGYGEGPGDALKARFCRIAGVDGRPRGLDWSAYDHLDEAMAGFGARGRDLPTFTDLEHLLLEDFMAGIEANRFSWTWSVAEDVRVRAAAETRAWAETTYGPLADVPPTPYEVTWRAYDLP